MKKLLYVALEDWNKETGVGKKIINEIKAFRKKGFDSSVQYIGKTKKLSRLLPFTGNLKYSDVEIPNDLNVLYIRYELANYPFIKFLKKIKKNYPQVEIVIEIGTYPYIDELKQKRNYLYIFRDKFYSMFLKFFYFFISMSFLPIWNGTICHHCLQLIIYFPDNKL